MNWSKVWIIGNGPSRNSFDDDLLKDQSVLVLNKALFHYHDKAEAFFSLDQDFVTKHEALIRAFKGEKYIALADNWPEIPDVHFLGWSYAEGLSEDPNVVCTGCNSGYAAINLCVLNGSKEIHLVGYDMDPSENTQYKFWAKTFDTMIPQLKRHSVKVFNHNKNSFITAFPRI
jgi:hypothetical protein